MYTTNVYEYITFINDLILFIYSIELRIMFTLRHKRFNLFSSSYKTNSTQ